MKKFLDSGMVQFVGLKEEEEFEKTKALSAAQNALTKISRFSKGDTTLIIHIKRNQVQGKKTKYLIRARVSWPGHFFEAKNDDWNFLSTTQDVLLTLTREVKKRHQKETRKKI